MKVVVFGASAGKLAAKAGHEVTAVARSRFALPAGALISEAKP